MDNLDNILKKVIDKDKEALDISKSSEMGNKHKFRIPKNRPISNVIVNIDYSMVTRKQFKQKWDRICLLYLPIKAKECEGSIKYESWTTILQEELNQFVRNDVWYLVPRPKDKYVIDIKWIFKNK